MLDQLEELVNEGWRIPATRNVLISEERFMDLVDQMRLAIPAEIRQAQRVQRERERMLAQAQEEARRLTSQASQQASKLVDDQVLTQQARTRSEEIIANAYEEAMTLRREADVYALEALQGLQRQLEAVQEQVRNGIVLLEQSQQLDEPRGADGHTPT